MKVKIIFRWYDFWIGLFLDRKNRFLYVFPVPMLGLRVYIPRKKPKWKCYEIWRPNIPDNGCTEQCKECAEKQKMLEVKA